MIQERVNSLAKGLTKTTAKAFADNVVLGLQEGYNANKLTKELMKY